MRLLLEAGADPCVRNADGLFPYSLMSAFPGLKELVSETALRGRLGAGKTMEGDAAVLRGLSRADLNGEHVRVGPYDPDTDRYSVTLPTGVAIAVKRVNVVSPHAPIAATAPLPVAPPRCVICEVRCGLLVC